jgi:hypothetical protein
MSTLTLKGTLTGIIPFVNKSVSEPFDFTYKIPDESMTIALPIGAALEVSEKGAQITIDAKEGPIDLFDDKISIGGTKPFDFHLGKFHVVGDAAITA